VKNKVVVFLRERTGIFNAPSRPRALMIEGGASFAYVFGSVLVFLLVFEALTGLALSAFYSPSSTDAWGSVAYLEDQAQNHPFGKQVKLRLMSWYSRRTRRPWWWDSSGGCRPCSSRR